MFAYLRNILRQAEYRQNFLPAANREEVITADLDERVFATNASVPMELYTSSTTAIRVENCFMVLEIF